MNTSISEFERTKPTKTMKSINELENYIEEVLAGRRDETNPYKVITAIYIKLKEIKQLFKAGE